MRSQIAQNADSIEHCLARLAEAAASNTGVCGLQTLVGCADLPGELIERIQAAIADGFTLRCGLPHHDNELLQEWLGVRWWLIHRSQLDRELDWSALVASRMNRSDREFACWPQWIEAATRWLARDEKTWLHVPDTTLASIAKPIAASARLNCLEVQLPSNQSCSVGNWLPAILQHVVQNKSVAYATLFMSPASSPAAAFFEPFPLRDRVTMAVARRVLVLSVRPEGNIARLLQKRIDESRFWPGTVCMRLSRNSAQAQWEWLSRGAVGWYLPFGSRILSATAHERMNTGQCANAAMRVSQPALFQWTARSSLVRSTDYLVHCVRGDESEAFRNGSAEAVIDAILQGSLNMASAFASLLKIIGSWQLRASGKMLRCGSSAVSFTALTLEELAERRRYQAHLGRWDWEPYGLMIRREVLEQLGARPVIYGDDRMFDGLSLEDRPYFQPALRRSARQAQDNWQAEKEWRLCDNLRLKELPRDCLQIFVANSAEAQSLARHSPWPVIWQQASQTRRSPTSAKLRRRNSVRTSRN